MKMFVRSFVAGLALAFGHFQPVLAETPALSFDLNPLLRDCLSPGADCLASLPVVGFLFDRNQPGRVIHREDLCDSYKKDWCVDFNNQDSQSGFTRCRQAKMEMFEEIARAKGEWPYTQYEGKKSRYFLNMYYMDKVEKSRTPAGKAPYFNCNVKQQVAFIKAKCGDLISKDWPTTLRHNPYTQDNLCSKKTDL